MESLFSSEPNLQALIYVLAPVVAALLTGVAIGWFVWGGEREAGGAREGGGPDKDAVGEADASATRDPSRLAELEVELAKAKELLRASEDREARLASEMSTLDTAVKRAAGRVALVMRGLKA